VDPNILLLILRIAIAASLYIFLAYILVHLWKDIQTSWQSRPIAPQTYLENIEGEGLERAYKLEELNLIGRANDNTIVLNDGTVSGYHARISYQQDQWWLEDLGSRNGTMLNEIHVTEPLVITYGDELQFGNIRLRLSSGSMPEATSHHVQSEDDDQSIPQG
jgi:pSer/pThr/pTyr-binding forkhead associated (FHA) protein